MSASSVSQPASRVARVASFAWAAALTAGLAWLAATFGEFNALAYRAIDPLMLLQNIPAVFLAFALAQLLMRKRVFRWRPSDLFFRKGKVRAAGSASLLLVAMRVPVVGVFAAALLVFNLPTIAALEEFIFREGMTDWKGMFIRSAAFGLAHLGTDLPLGSALSIGVVGLWFSHWYFLGGIELAAQAHFSYLLIIFSLVLPALAYGRVKLMLSASHH